MPMYMTIRIHENVMIAFSALFFFILILLVNYNIYYIYVYICFFPGISRILDFRKAPLPPIIFKSKNRVGREADLTLEIHFRHHEFQCKPPQTEISITLRNYESQEKLLEAHIRTLPPDLRSLCPR